MKFSRIFGAIFFLIVLHLTLFVSASTIQRSLSDDIRNGISIAGKLLGVDSPSNIAVVSNIAELVARAFSQNNNPQNSWDRRQFSSQPPEHLENFDENPSNVNANHHGNSNSNEQQNIDDNVIIGSNADSGTSTTTTAIGHGFLGHMLRILGMDTNKIGALAINGIIFIAQMIGRSFVTAFTSMAGKMGAKPNENISMSERSRRLADDNTNKNPNESGETIWENAIDWIFQQSKSNPLISQHLDTMLDKNLPDRIVELVDYDDDNGDGTGDGMKPKTNTDCIKQLLCKTAPFIWGMQNAISTKISDTDAEPNEADDASSTSPPDNVDDRLNAFYKYLPSIAEFTKHGMTCENQYKNCKIF